LIEGLLFLGLVAAILRWMVKESGKDYDRENTRYRTRDSTAFPSYTSNLSTNYDIDEILRSVRNQRVEIPRVEIPRFDSAFNSMSSSHRRRSPTLIRFDKMSGEWDEFD